MSTVWKTFLFSVSLVNSFNVFYCKMTFLLFAWIVVLLRDPWMQSSFITFSHRHQDDHKCEKLEVQKPRMAATKELVQRIVGQRFTHGIVNVPDFMHILLNICVNLKKNSESKDGSKTKGRKGAKNSATAAKVALMKLKLHAAGDKGLPQVNVILTSLSSDVLVLLLTDLWFWPFRQREPIFRYISPKNVKPPANPCSSVPNGV